MSSATGEVGQLLLAWSGGDQTALEKLIPIVYAELRRLARYYMRAERANHSLQTTALVHEAYLRLTDYTQMNWQSRAHFFAAAAQVMRRVLVEHARRRQELKRGGSTPHLSLDEAAAVFRDRPPDLVELDDALRSLAAMDERKSRVVELRFFGGLSVQETAEALKISAPTVMRDWNAAKAWLYRELSSRSDK